MLFFFFLAVSKTDTLEFSIRNATCYRNINPTCCALLIHTNWQRDEDIVAATATDATRRDIPYFILSRRQAQGEHTRPDEDIVRDRKKVRTTVT